MDAGGRRGVVGLLHPESHVKFRRHHNNDGRRQIQTGSTGRFIARLAQSLGVPVRREQQHGRGCWTETSNGEPAQPGCHPGSFGGIE